MRLVWHDSSPFGNLRVNALFDVDVSESSTPKGHWTGAEAQHVAARTSGRPRRWRLKR
jgi:hypothetical protein